MAYWEQKTEDQPKCVTACGHYEKETIYLEYLVKAKISALMKKYPSLEWLTYLIGDKENNIVKDMIIPNQKVTSGSVTEIQTDPNIQIMGVVHSHHGMGLKDFSGIDHNFINGNHDISILVWHGGMKAQKRTTLPCGSTITSEVNVEFFYENFNVGDWNDEADDKIHEGTYQYEAGEWEDGVFHPKPNQYVGPYTGPYSHTPVRTYAPRTPPRTHVPRYEDRTPLQPGQKWPVKKWDTGKRNSKKADDRAVTDAYNNYLDRIVYGTEDMVDLSEDGNNGDFSASELHDVEEHFRRIEENECGIKHSKNLPAIAGSRVPPPCAGVCKGTQEMSKRGETTEVCVEDAEAKKAEEEQENNSWPELGQSMP